MTYYKDLSPYEYHGRRDGIQEKNTVNIGWIGDNETFERGAVSQTFLLALWEYMKYPIHKTRGWHTNVGLDREESLFTAIFEGYNILLGTYEIRVIDAKNNIVYASPSMILQYIINHHYLPPQQYIDAVINGPKPGSNKYCKLVKNIYSQYSRYDGNMECPFCRGRRIASGLWQEKNYKQSDGIEIIEHRDGDVKNQMKECFYDKYLICECCGQKWIDS